MPKVCRKYKGLVFEAPFKSLHKVSVSGVTRVWNLMFSEVTQKAKHLEILYPCC